MPPLLKLMRPGDWTKNVFVLPALVFSIASSGAPDTELSWLLGRTALAVIAFCLLSSGFYAINDVLDVERDRAHPVKRNRPIASGAVSRRAGTILGIVLMASSLAVGAAVNMRLLLVLVVYALLQVAYNARVKRVLFVDVVAVALGFALRATGGAVAIEVPISVWLLLCVFFLCLYLGFIKRLCDLSAAQAAGDETWRSPAGYHDRDELRWLLGLSATLALVTYLMYALSEHARELFGVRANGFALLSPLVMIVMYRFFRRASRGRSDSPLATLLEDRTVLVSIVLFSAGVLGTLFLPGIEELLTDLFGVDGAGGPVVPAEPVAAGP